MNNAAAIGYAILACKKLGMTQQELRKLESFMHQLLDTTTEEEAEEVYKNN